MLLTRQVSGTTEGRHYATVPELVAEWVAKSMCTLPLGPSGSVPTSFPLSATVSPNSRSRMVACWVRGPLAKFIPLGSVGTPWCAIPRATRTLMNIYARPAITAARSTRRKTTGLPAKYTTTTATEKSLSGVRVSISS